MQINNPTSPLKASCFLQECAKFAYGSGTFEGRSGGAGNIGMLGGRVVKFRTHSGERKGEVTSEMAESCAALKENLILSLQVLLSQNGVRTRDESQFLEEARRDLGLQKFQANGTNDQKAKSLLDRKVVAKVLNKFEKLMKTEVFRRESGAYAEVSSKDVNTQFSAVRKRELFNQLDGLASCVDAVASGIKREIFAEGISDILSQPDWQKLVHGYMNQSQNSHARRLQHPVTGSGLWLEDSRGADAKCNTLWAWLREVQNDRTRRNDPFEKYNPNLSQVYEFPLANQALAALLELLDDMRADGFDTTAIQNKTTALLNDVICYQQDDWPNELYPRDKADFNQAILKDFAGKAVM